MLKADEETRRRVELDPQSLSVEDIAVLNAPLARLLLHLQLLPHSEVEIVEEGKDLQVRLCAESGVQVARELGADHLLLLGGVIRAVGKADSAEGDTVTVEKRFDVPAAVWSAGRVTRPDFRVVLVERKDRAA